LTWKSFASGIALGYGIFAATDLVNYSLRAQLGSGWNSTLSVVTAAAYNISVLTWFAYTLIPQHMTQRVQTEFAYRPVFDRWNQAALALVTPGVASGPGHTYLTEIERTVGAWRLLACYFASVITAALTQLFVPALFGAPPAPTIGASGGVFGLLLAYALLFPHRKVVPLIPPIPMPAWLFATLYAGLELFMGVTGTLSGIAHFAHLGGMIGSALVVMQWRRGRR